MEKRDVAGNSEIKGFKNPSLMQVGIIYSLCVLLYFFIGSMLMERDFNKGAIINQFVLIFLPPVLFLVLFKFDLKKVLRLNKIRPVTLVIIFFLTVFSIPLVAIINLLNHFLVKALFGRAEVMQPPISTDFPGVLVSFFVIGIVAGICEEVLFRGVIQRGFEKYGVKKAIIITALLFGLMHLNFQSLFGTFLLGVLIGFIVYRTNSLYGGIFAHFANNSIAVALSLYALRAEEFLGDIEVEGDIFSQFENLPSEMFAATVIGLIAGYSLIFIFFGVIFGFLMYLFIRNTSKTKVDNLEKKEPVKLKAVLAFVPGLLVIAFVYVIQGLLMGEFVEPEIIQNIYEYMF
ncbi:CPBP family intramembrane glutamic endopeptidase [Herbivorax sp. ANBcel31]|uniref:CPBP family intramembrane glutamic endopeptidase n=1 Tax=Herbivorax sp. ANBcel31 TaxID=3069754 RepID=UPI0027B6F509|nr:CPBP family intramembrane glutamic endopeptidase [Herbivorax sp. ANBcel31]MDQ2086056.1 CPBP family intramembrane glutamic endopeptidase [Herbivorax sp. ANBcel31]